MARADQPPGSTHRRPARISPASGKSYQAFTSGSAPGTGCAQASPRGSSRYTSRPRLSQQCPNGTNFPPAAPPGCSNASACEISAGGVLWPRRCSCACAPAASGRHACFEGSQPKARRSFRRRAEGSPDSISAAADTFRPGPEFDLAPAGPHSVRKPRHEQESQFAWSQCPVESCQ